MDNPAETSKSTHPNQKGLLFLIGVIGGLVTLVMFLLVLDAFKVISFDNALQSTIGRLFAGNKIQVVSEIPGYQISITDEEKLNNYLTEYKFFEDNRVLLFATGKRVTVNRVIFILTDKPQTHSKTLMQNGSVLTSMGQSYDANSKTMRIYYHLSKEYYSPRPDESLSNVVSGRIVAIVFRLTSLKQYLEAEGDKVSKQIGAEVIKDGVIFTVKKTQ